MTGYLRTDALQPGDPGDPGGVVAGLSEFAIELWLMGSADGTPNATEYIVSGPLVSGFAKFYVTVTTGGVVNFSVRNSLGTTFGPLQSVAVRQDDSSWVHIVGTISAGTVSLYINNVLVASDNGWGASTFSTSLDASTYFYVGSPGNGQAWGIDELAFYRHGLTQARVTAHYIAGRNRGLVQQRSDERIIAALDNSTSIAGRSIRTGARSILAERMAGQAPLDSVRSAVSCEAVDACFFTSCDGRLISLDSAHRSASPWNTSQVTIGDAGGSEIPYLNIDVEYSDSFIANVWDVTRDTGGVIQAGEGVTQTASDSTSISRYRRRPQTLSNIPLVADSDAATIASAMLAKYKDPMQRVTEVSFDSIDPSATEAFLQRELMDRITVKRTPPGGGSRISQDLFIQKISISGANDGTSWQMSWGVSPL